MLGPVEHASIAGADPLGAAYHQSALTLVSTAVSDGTRPDGKESLSFAPVDEGAPNWASFGEPARPEFVIQEKVSSVQTKLKDFTAQIDLSAIAALIVRLNNDLRKSARQDLWAAVASDVAAQGAAAKAIRDSGLCQLFGAILTSAGGLAGAGLNLKGARRSQARFDEITTRTQRPLPGSELRSEGPSSPTRQAQRIEAGEDGLGHLAEREGAPPSSDLAPDVPNRPAGQAQRSEAEDNVLQDAAASDHIAEQEGGNSVTPHASEIEPAGQGHAPTPPEGPSSPTSQAQRIEAGEDGLRHLAEREGAPPSSDLAPDVPNRPAGQAQRSEAEDNVLQDAAASDHLAEQGGGNSVTPHASEIEPAGQGHAPMPPEEPSSPTSQAQRIDAGEDGLGQFAEREGAPPSSGLAPDVPNRPAGQAQRSEAEDNVLQDAAASDHLAEQGSGNSVTPHASEIEPAGQGHAPTPPPEPDARPHDTDALELSRITEAQTAAQGEVMKWTGLSAIATEASKIPGTGLTMGATHYQEEQAKREADSTKAKAQAEDEKQFIESYQTVIQDMLDKLAELRRADSETRSKLVSMA